jgi:hypothetical protein
MIEVYSTPFVAYQLDVSIYPLANKRRATASLDGSSDTSRMNQGFDSRAQPVAWLPSLCPHGRLNSWLMEGSLSRPRLTTQPALAKAMNGQLRPD